MTYEAARSITGPYLAVLGASGVVVGFVAGLGELIGYASAWSRVPRRPDGEILGDHAPRLRPESLCRPAPRARRPLGLAAALMIAERVGKAIRTPARDAMLSHATKEVGHGWGFGLHEAMDQAGAVLGPLAVAAVLAFRGGYRLGFGVLLVPALCARCAHGRMAALPSPARPRDDFGARRRGDLPASFLAVPGRRRVDRRRVCRLPAHRLSFRQAEYRPRRLDPGLLCVRHGRRCPGRPHLRLPLRPPGACSSSSSPPFCLRLFAPLVFFGGFYPALAGMALWGVGMGAQESILRAAIAGMVPPDDGDRRTGSSTRAMGSPGSSAVH